LSAAGRDPEAGDSGLDAAGFVLAGGQSSRMGRDKALLPFAGQPLVAHALSTLRQAGLTASIAGASSSFAGLAPVVEDAQPGLGPLSGICATLASTSAHHAVFLPVDLPLLPASLISFLLRHAQTTGRAVTLPSVNGFAQTFPAVLDRAVLPLLQTELGAGRSGCFSAFQAGAAIRREPMSVVAAELLAQAGQALHPGGLPASCWFFNVNTPEDFERAIAVLQLV
jgi:molybdopterin-guanine dinucleotide biosynthesis protein A